LIGLLFVAVSLAPGRIFGPAAVGGGQDAALSAFTALVNAFFLSLGGLVPKANIGQATTILGLLALVETLRQLRRWPIWRREKRASRGLALVLVGIVIYGGELWVGQQLLRTPTDTSALTPLPGLLLGMYAIGLLRSWELLGAQEHHAGTLALLSRLLATEHPAPSPPQATEPPASTESASGSAHPDATPAALTGNATAPRNAPAEQGHMKPEEHAP
jgi:hypothetical protein